MLATLRNNRLAQAALAGVLIVAGAFAWWTISPLFLTTTLNEDLPARASATVAPAASIATATAAAPPPPRAPRSSRWDSCSVSTICTAARGR